ncbi:MAG: phosphoribosylformylglycinamidine synthase subunit PurL, partial [Actinobacteria bacterium]
IAHVPDADRCVPPDLAADGNVLLLLGHTEPEFAGSHLDLIQEPPDDLGVAPAPDPDAASSYRRLHSAIQAGLVESCHDLSEGGLAVALAEMCIAGRLGAEIETLPHDDLVTALFSESSGRLIVEVTPRSVSAFMKVMDDRALRIGEVIDTPQLHLPGIESLDVADLANAFNTTDGMT